MSSSKFVFRRLPCYDFAPCIVPMALVSDSERLRHPKKVSIQMIALIKNPIPWKTGQIFHLIYCGVLEILESALTWSYLYTVKYSM